MMSFNKTMRLAGLSFLAVLIFLTAGCAGASTTPPAPANPTVVIIQYVTQVVATVTPGPPTPTPLPPTKSAPVAPSGYDPYSVEPYYPVAGCAMASRLHIGDIAFVATGGSQFGIHVDRGVGFAPLKRKLVQGELLNIIGEATCNRNGLVWEVLADSDNTRGFVLEGNGETYWLMPTGQTYDEKEMRDRLKKLD
jgi:hypothetical protein